MIRFSRALRAALCALGCAFAASAPVWAQTVTVAQGPMIGAVTTKSAAVWFRLSAPASARLRVTYKGLPAGTYVYSDPVAVTAAADFTGKIAMPALATGMTYTYQVGVTGPDGVENWGGSYNFATLSGNLASASFAVLSDFSNKLKSSPALRDALSKQPDFLAVIGDLDHRNPASKSKQGIYPIQDAPQVLADLRNMHRDTRDFGTAIGADFANGLIGLPNTGKMQIPFYYGWDDHDFCTNNADSSCPFAPQAVQAAREYYLYQADNGIDGTNGCPQASTYQRIDYGPILSVFILDARSARNEAAGTMLGTCQFNWLVQGLVTSNATWKVVLSPVPFNPMTKTWDAWQHFPTERANLVAQLQQHGVKNLVFLSGDVHSGGAVDDGTHSTWPEISVPHANMPDDWINTYCETFGHKTEARSEPGLWTIGSLVEPDFGVPNPTCQGEPMNTGTQYIWPTPGVYALTGKGHAGYVRVDANATTLTASVIGFDGLVRSGQRADGSTAPMVLQLTAQ